MNVNRNHWVLLVVDFKTKQMKLLDSLTDNYDYYGNRSEAKIRKFIEEEFKIMMGFEFSWDGWGFLNVKDLPKQENSFDCGICACLFRKDLVADRPITFKQADVTLHRRKVRAEMLAGKLFYDSWFQEGSKTATNVSESFVYSWSLF